MVIFYRKFHTSGAMVDVPLRSGTLYEWLTQGLGETP